MDKNSDNPLRLLDRRKANYPLIVAGVGLFIVLFAGMITSAKSHEMLDAGLFLLAAAVLAVAVLLNVAANRRLAALDDRKFIRWDSATAELQRQNVNIEVRELARLLKASPQQHSELVSAYLVAQDLALRQIQQVENLPLMRHVSILNSPFDGILIDQELITCIETAFLVAPDIRQDRIESMLKKVAKAMKDLAEMKSRLRLRLMLVLVTQLSAEDDEQLRAKLVTRRFTDTPVDIDIRLLDFEMLQKVYVSE